MRRFCKNSNIRFITWASKVKLLAGADESITEYSLVLKKKKNDQDFKIMPLIGPVNHNVAEKWNLFES